MLPSPASPLIFSIGSFELRWYSVCILIGILLGEFMALRRAKKHSIKEDYIYDLTLYGVIFGIIGARIFHVLYYYQHYFANISEIPKVWEGGLAIHGGILFGVITIYIYTKIKKLSFLKILDIFVPSLLIGQIIGRFGNYFNQEAFGTPTSLPWGIYISPEKRPMEFAQFASFHPTFLYEGLWNALTLLFILYIEKKHTKRKGMVVGLYLICYGIGRSLIEYIRLDATFLGPLRFVHWISIILVIIGTILFKKSIRPTT